MNVSAISVEIFSAALAMTSPNPIAAATGNAALRIGPSVEDLEITLTSPRLR